MKTLTPTQAAYVAGFLDGDGSIFVRLKPNAAYRYGFQIAPYVVSSNRKRNSRSWNDCRNYLEQVMCGYATMVSLNSQSAVSK